MQTSKQEEEEETLQSSTPRGGKKATVLGRVRAHCSIVRLAKRREGLAVQSLAEHFNLPLTGFRAFVPERTKRFTTNLKVVPC